MPDPAPTPAPIEADAFATILRDLQAKHPEAEVESSECSLGKFIVRTPDEGSYSAFMALNGEPTKKVQAAMALCRRCILWPSLPVVDGWFGKKPGLSRPIADLLLVKAGAAEELITGK